jgi:hypothetical protein
VLWAAKAARNGKKMATDGKVGGKNGKDVREYGDIHADLYTVASG